MVVDSDPCGRSQWRGEVGHLASLAVGSSEEGLLEDEGIQADLFPSLDDDEEGWWWSLMASTTLDRRAEQSNCEGAKWEWGTFPPCAGTRIRPHIHVGRRSPAATGTGASTA
jgi:hypothetical protein